MIIQNIDREKMVKKLLIYTITTLTLLGCSDPEPDPVQLPIDHTVIVYMAADNNLSGNAFKNINMLERAFSDMLGARILVYYDQVNGKNQILEIARDDDFYEITSPIIAEYPDDHNPMLAATLTEVIADCRELSPTQRYSLVLWSHATGWLPQGMHPATAPEQSSGGVDRTFGNIYTYSDQMEIYDLAKALPSDIQFEYIYFDACHMGSIEVAYELKDKAKYFIASAAEVLANGYPYDEGIEALMRANVSGIAENFYNHYKGQTSEVLQSATISVTDLSKLKVVGAELKKLQSAVAQQPRAEQQFGRKLGSYDYRNLMWDFEDMVIRTYGEANSEALLSALHDAVIYEAATPILFKGDVYGEIDVDTHCGLTVYIPRLTQPQTLKIYTENYQWAKDTQFYNRAY